MKLSIISFTENGILLSEKIAKLPHEAECAIYTKCGAYCKEGRTVEFVTESIYVSETVVYGIRASLYTQRLAYRTDKQALWR